MTTRRSILPASLQPWVAARRKLHLSHAEVQMARELGMNPNKLGKLANHRLEPWKLPLREFIAHTYAKRFGRPRPERVRSLEDVAAAKAAKRSARKAAKTAVKNGLPDAAPVADDLPRS
jgi:hypothetical protein